MRPVSSRQFFAQTPKATRKLIRTQETTFPSPGPFPPTFLLSRPDFQFFDLSVERRQAHPQRLRRFFFVVLMPRQRLLDEHLFEILDSFLQRLIAVDHGGCRTSKRC